MGGGSMKKIVPVRLGQVSKCGRTGVNKKPVRQ